jgi:hypothetical protein
VAQVIEGITRLLGDNIWASTFVGLTHGRLTSLPDNLTYGLHPVVTSNTLVVQMCTQLIN